MQSATAEQGNQRRTDQYGNIGRAPYLISGDGAAICDGDGAEGRPGRVEEERMRLGDGQPGRRRLTPGRTAGEGSGEREDGGERRPRSDGQQIGDGRTGTTPVHPAILCSDDAVFYSEALPPPSENFARTPTSVPLFPSPALTTPGLIPTTTGTGESTRSIAARRVFASAVNRVISSTAVGNRLASPRSPLLGLPGPTGSRSAPLPSTRSGRASSFRSARPPRNHLLWSPSAVELVAVVRLCKKQ
jgi:hypothetical protein